MKQKNECSKKNLTLLIVCILLSSPIFLHATESETRFKEEMEKFRIFYQENLQKHGIVGSTFMFLHNNEVLAKEFYGLADKDKDIKIDEDTIYHWASITKTLTGIAIMQLRDRGLLSLNDPIVKYIPDLYQVHNPYGDMKDITIRHLMSHCSGFRGSTWPWKNKPWHPHEPLHWEQLVAMFPYTEIHFKPGSKWSYSNPALIFLGRVIEQLTTDDWEVYIDKNIFKPLGMYRSYFDTTPYHLLKHKCRSYFLADKKLTPADPDVNTGITVSNGGLKCPFPDFIKYLNFLMGDPKKQNIYDQVLKRSSLEEMFEAQIEINNFEPDFQGSNRKDAMGLTFFIEENFGKRFICHSGGQNAYVTHFFLHPETRSAYVVGFNTLAAGDEQNTRRLDREIKEYLFKNIFPLFD